MSVKDVLVCAFITFVVVFSVTYLVLAWLHERKMARMRDPYIHDRKDYH